MKPDSLNISLLAEGTMLSFVSRGRWRDAERKLFFPVPTSWSALSAERQQHAVASRSVATSHAHGGQQRTAPPCGQLLPAYQCGFLGDRPCRYFPSKLCREAPPQGCPLAPQTASWAVSGGLSRLSSTDLSRRRLPQASRRVASWWVLLAQRLSQPLCHLIGQGSPFPICFRY